MPNEGSVTRWIFELEEGDDEAARQLWDRFFDRLKSVAAGQLRNHPSAAADEEDVALHALETFFRRREQGEFRELRDRDELWRLLAVITKRKALNLIRAEKATTRGSGKTQSGSALLDAASAEPTPQHTAEILDEIQRLLSHLLKQHDQLQFIVIRKLQGCSTKEIAEELGCTRRTVQRKFARICIMWEEDLHRRR